MTIIHPTGEHLVVINGPALEEIERIAGIDKWVLFPGKHYCHQYLRGSSGKVYAYIKEVTPHDTDRNLVHVTMKCTDLDSAFPVDNQVTFTYNVAERTGIIQVPWAQASPPARR